MREAKYNDDKKLDRNEEHLTWLRPAPATKYFNMGRNALDRLAVQCDAKKKVGNRIVLYDVKKIDRYLNTL